MASGRVRIYSNASSVGTDNNVTATYWVVSMWSGDELTSYKVTKI